MQEQIDRDLKAALLGGERKKAETLRVIKSALLYETLAQNARQDGLSDEAAQKVLARESKKRTEAAELYKKAGENDRAEAELTEKQIIDAYLPDQLSESELESIISEEIAKLDNPSMSDMGRVIGAVRAKTGAQADGAMIARRVKELLEKK